MKNEILVSVGIPTFNRPLGLREALQRICEQTYKNLEIIVSDNHSINEKDVASVVAEFAKKDSRIKFHRQPKNIGAIPNFRFLLGEATGEYFMWAADDDLLEMDYIENCIEALKKNPAAIIGITGFDVEDCMQMPVIKKEYTKYLQELPAQSTYQRLCNYIVQPEYYGKYRILWGVIKRELLIDAFDEVQNNLSSSEDPMWSYMPIDFAVLSRGDLAVASCCLFHAFLLPTSDGKKEQLSTLERQLRLNRRGFRAFSMVVTKSQYLTSWEKHKLKYFLLLEEIYAIARMLPYHLIRKTSPRVARNIKKFWFERLMRK